MNQMDYIQFIKKVRLDISGLVDGVYYLRLESDGKLCSIKVIVQH